MTLGKVAKKKERLKLKLNKRPLLVKLEGEQRCM